MLFLYIGLAPEWPVTNQLYLLRHFGDSTNIVLIVSQRLFTAWREEDLLIVIPSVFRLSDIWHQHGYRQWAVHLCMIWRGALVVSPAFIFPLPPSWNLEGASCNVYRLHMYEADQFWHLACWFTSGLWSWVCKISLFQIWLVYKMIRNSFCFRFCHNSLRDTAVRWGPFNCTRLDRYAT